MIACLVALVGFAARAASAQDAPLSRAEASRYEETSRYEDVTNFFAELQKRSPLVRLTNFGTSHEGRALPLVILADPPITQPREAAASGKPVVFVMANIHAGEVEGKEALQHFARRVATGDLRPLLGKLVVLLAPIYNADGNERISTANRPSQNGPIGGVGSRENAQGLDLNRDYIKLESSEARALVRLFNQWDPHLTVDLHATDGSYHGYHLTYSIPLNPATEPRLAAFHRDSMMPAIGRAMLERHGLRTYYYGNFTRTPPADGSKLREWRAFTHQPRIGQNYVGLRNRLTILSEAYVHLDFKRRVEVTERFVEEICRFAAANADAVRRVTREADEATRRQAGSPALFRVGIAHELTPLPQPVDLLVGEVTRVKNPRTGRDMVAMVEDKFVKERMLDYGMFEATRSEPAALAYLVAAGPDTREAIAMLHAHGIVVEEVAARVTVEVERFVVTGIKRAPRAFQGHNELQLAGSFKTENAEFPAGTVVVRTSQPLGRLAACLLEPAGDDGLVTWNFLDAALAVGKAAPVSKLMREQPLPTRSVPRADGR